MNSKAPGLWPLAAIYLITLLGMTLMTKSTMGQESKAMLQGGDNMHSATFISSIPYNDYGTTVGYTHDLSPSCLSDNTAPDVFYEYTPVASDHIMVSLCGSDYDTGLAIFLDGPDNEIACNDDYCGYQSQINDIEVIPGHTYYFEVTGYGSSSGNYSIIVTTVFPPLGILSGTVTNHRDFPIYNVIDSVFDSFHLLAGVSRTDSAGDFSFSLPPDTYDIKLVKASYIDTTVRGIIIVSRDTTPVVVKMRPHKDHGTIATARGPHIYDYELAYLIDKYIPADQANSTILFFTQCYGGDCLDDFSDRANTAAYSANEAGKSAYYGGFHDDAANGLRAAPGRSSSDVFVEGYNGRNSHENPQIRGVPQLLEPPETISGVRSRHVLVYGGLPNGMDNHDRDTIVANFRSDPNTTVTTVGDEGTNGWQYEASWEGLENALQHIGPLMNPNEQFVLFVTDHGDFERTYYDPPRQGLTDNFISDTIIFDPQIIQDMQQDPANVPVITLFSYGPNHPSPVNIHTKNQSFTNVPFDVSVDFNGDGDLSDIDEGWKATQPIDENMLDLSGEVISVEGGDSLDLGFISLGTGTISRRSGGCRYIPGDINGEGKVNGIDVVYSVNFFKGGNAPPTDCYPTCPNEPSPFYAAGDINGSCNFNGIDITYFVNYLKGGLALTFCPDCPPLGR